MKWRTAVDFVRTGQLPLLIGVSRFIAPPVYRMSFLTGASSSGVLPFLAEKPRTLDEIAELLKASADGREAIEAWVEFGVKIGDLGKTGSRYKLKSFWARQLARPHNDPIGASLEELIRHNVIFSAPKLVSEQKKLSLADQDGRLIARASRVAEPFIREAIDDAMPKNAFRMMEVGCGTGIHLKHALSRNPQLSAVALELQPDVAEVARGHFQEWGLSDRVELKNTDVRQLTPDASFDFVTLHQVIYYFPVAQRIELLSHLRRFLKPNGRFLLTSACQGGDLGFEVLNLWFCLAEFGGALPKIDLMVEQFRAAGFSDIKRKQIMPGSGFWAFSGTNVAV